MADYEKLAAEIQSVAERTATNRPVVAKAVDKLAIGRNFKASNITVTQPLVDGDILIRHNPPDGNDIRMMQRTSDNALLVHNESSGNTNAWFYPNGRTYVDLTDNSIDTRHYTDFSIQSSHIADSQVNSRILAPSSVGSDEIAGSSVGNGELADGAVGDGKIYSGGVNYNHMSGDTKNQGTGTSSMRTIGSGSTSSAAGSNHTHASINFNSQYTIAQKEMAANLVSTVRDMVLQPALAPLRDLVLELAHQLMDETDHTVQEKVNRLKTDPAYALEFNMKHDPEYYAAWSIANIPEYAAKMVGDPAVQEMAAHAREVYARIEDDPVIVEDYLRRKGPFS